MMEGFNALTKQNKLSFLVLNPSALVPTTVRFILLTTLLYFLFLYPRRVFTEQDLDGFAVDLLAILHFGGQVEENSKDLGSLVFAMSQLEVANSVLKKRHPEECSM